VVDDTLLKLLVPATLPAARAATERLMALGERFDEESRALYETAVMEWLVNIVKHSYVPADGGSIRLVAQAGPLELHLVIEDRGRGLSAVQFEAAPLRIDFDPQAVADLPESGMGLAILKSVMDSVLYEQQQGINRLIAVKRWSA
jgi:serine/threonine-protein kinase RsbW